MKSILVLVFSSIALIASPQSHAAERAVVVSTAVDANWDAQCVQFVGANDGTTWCVTVPGHYGHDWMPDPSLVTGIAGHIFWVQLATLPGGRVADKMATSLAAAWHEFHVLTTAVATDGTAWNLIDDNHCYYCSHSFNSTHWYPALPPLPDSE